MNEESTLQPDLDKPPIPQSAEEPMLSPVADTPTNMQSTRNTTEQTLNTVPENIGKNTVAVQELDVQIDADPTSKEINQTNTQQKEKDGETLTLKDMEDTPEIPMDFLRTLALKKIVHVNVSKEEVDSWIKMNDQNYESMNSHLNTSQGLYFEKIGSRILRPRKRQYHTDCTRRVTTSNRFYQGQCEDTTPRKTQKTTLKAEIGPSEERIQSSRYPQRNRRPPKYTYPVMQEWLKQEEESPDELDLPDPTVSSSEETDSSLSSSSKTSGRTTNNQDVGKEDKSSNTNANTVENDVPKGSLKTKFYGVKKPTSGDAISRRKRNYKCPECPQSYPNQSLLNNHFKAEHPPVTCPTCDLSFNTPSTLARHKYSHGELKFKCAEFNKGFPFEKDHECHMIHHKKVKSHFCVKPGCGKGFFNAHNLKKHVKIHDKNIWKCQQCQ